MISGRFLKVALLFTALVSGLPGTAFAGETVGGIINNVTLAWDGLPGFMSLIDRPGVR